MTPKDESNRSGVDFEFDKDQVKELESSLKSCSRNEITLLNQFVHDPEWINELILADHLGEAFRRSVTSLKDAGLLEQTGSGCHVPDDVIFLPDGPGCRSDQFSGVVHRLTESVIRNWYELIGDESVDSDPNWLLHRKLAKQVHDSRRDLPDGLLGETLDDEAPFHEPEQVQINNSTSAIDFYSNLKPETSDVDALFAAGVLLPFLDDQEQVAGFCIADAYRSKTFDKDQSTVGQPEDENREFEWERQPFSPAEQLKFSLIASDAIPFRRTENDTPHQFDIKEAARITDWPVEHLEFLTSFCIEHDLLSASSERYYLSESSQEWDKNEYTVNLFLTSIYPRFLEMTGENSFRGRDLSPGKLLREMLEYLSKINQPLTTIRVQQVFSESPETWNVLFQSEVFVGKRNIVNEVIEGFLEHLYQLGLVDRRDGDEETFYRINDRGLDQVETGQVLEPDQEPLPFILQPDGQLLVPIESSLEDFRRVNPFALLVKADRMIGYQVDRQSLVQALNEGWNASEFRRFLESKTESIPDPLRDLFDETIGDVNDVEITRVHHLISFENGATAAKAVNILNNYDPIRLDETTVALRSETNEDTIRRNLSRGGIRLGAGDRDTALSPLK